MRIIERHDLIWSQRITCPKCTSVLEIEPSDISYQPGSGVQWDYEPAYCHTTCPVCARRIRVTNVPDWVQSQARSNHGCRYPGN